MVTEAAYAALVAENHRLTEHLAAALQRIAELEARVGEWEAKKTPLPDWVKANVPERAAKPRRKRAAEHNPARRYETPTQIVEHRIDHCPDCGSALGGVHVGRTRQVLDLPPPPPVEVTEHRVGAGGAVRAGGGVKPSWTCRVRCWDADGWGWGSPAWWRTCASGCGCRCG
jgi:hypothetical protein